MNNNILRKMFIAIVVVYVISVSLLVLILHNQNKNIELKKNQAHLEAGARLVELVATPDYLSRAQKESSISPEEHKKLSIKLSQIAKTYNYSYIYALRNVGGKYFFIASSDSEENIAADNPDPYWIPYRAVPAALTTAYTSREIQFSSYSDEWGSFYSCFIPVDSPEGDDYILGADIDQQELNSILRKNSMYHFFQLMGLLFIMIPIAFLISRIQNVIANELETNAEIINSAQTCVLITSDDGKIIFANRSLLKILRKDTAGIRHKTIFEDEFRDFPMFDRLAICIKNGEKFCGDFPRKTLEGNTVWEYTIIDFIPHKQTQCPIYYVFCQDITELKKVQTQLQQNNVVLNYLTQASHKLLSNPDPFMVIPEVIENLGLCLGKTMVQVVIKEEEEYKSLACWSKKQIEVNPKSKGKADKPKPEFLFWEEKLSRGVCLNALSSDFPREFLNIIQVHNERFISVYPIVIDEKLWGFICTAKEDKQSEIDPSIISNTFISFSDSIGTAIKRANMEKRLRQATEAKSNFLSSMSHEIRTPLNGILGMITLMSNSNLNEDQIEYLKAMKSAGNQLYSLIGDVLDVSRIEAGKFTIHKAPMNIRGIIQNVSNIIHYQLSEKKLDFVCEVHDNVPDIIVADEMRIKQILVNLINNAIKFTQKGSIKLQLELLNPDILRFDLTDTGMGMSQEQAKNIFEPFYQAGTMESKSRGTGLGLVITKSLISLMHGDITVSSVMGKGSTFSFFIKVNLIQDKLS